MRFLLGALVCGMVIVGVAILGPWGNDTHYVFSPTPTPALIDLCTPLPLPDAPDTPEGQAYRSYVAYTRVALGDPTLVAQPYEPGVMRHVQDRIWHVKLWFDLKGPDGTTLRYVWDHDQIEVEFGVWGPLPKS